MASKKKHQADIKQSTLLKWVKPDHEPTPKKNENRVVINLFIRSVYG